RHVVVFPRRLRPGAPLAALALWPGTDKRSLTARLTCDGREVAQQTHALGPDAYAALLQLPRKLTTFCEAVGFSYQ
ncbi:Protein of unknown function, partial [Gryllus bimaculatus]